jgi:hypothetical protein
MLKNLRCSSAKFSGHVSHPRFTCFATRFLLALLKDVPDGRIRWLEPGWSWGWKPTSYIPIIKPVREAKARSRAVALLKKNMYTYRWHSFNIYIYKAFKFREIYRHNSTASCSTGVTFDPSIRFSSPYACFIPTHLIFLNMNTTIISTNYIASRIRLTLNSNK